MKLRQKEVKIQKILKIICLMMKIKIKQKTYIT
jgi:hypothetical protein